MGTIPRIASSRNPDRVWNDEDEDLEESGSAIRGILLALILSIPFWGLLATIVIFTH